MLKKILLILAGNFIFIFNGYGQVSRTVTADQLKPPSLLFTWPVPYNFTTGSIPYAVSGGAFVQDNARFFWDATNFRLGINVNTPVATLDVHSSVNPLIQANFTGAYSSSGGAAVQVLSTSSTPVTSGSRLGSFNFAGTTSGSTTSIGASINALATELWSSTAHGTKMIFNVTPDTTATRVSALILNQNSDAQFLGGVSVSGTLSASGAIATSGSITASGGVLTGTTVSGGVVLGGTVSGAAIVSGTIASSTVISNNVDTPNSGGDRIARGRFAGGTSTTVCSSTPCTLYNGTTSNVTSVTRSSSGTYTINFSPAFSQPPQCGFVGSNAANAISYTFGGSTTSTYVVITGVANTGVVTDTYIDFSCIGPK